MTGEGCMSHLLLCDRIPVGQKLGLSLAEYYDSVPAYGGQSTGQGPESDLQV